MNNLLITTLALSFLAASCGAKNENAGDAGAYRNKIVLGAFYDEKSSPTLDLSQLKDLPRIVDLKDDMSSVKNQSDRGVCSIFASVALLEGTIKKDLNKEVNLSEEFLNYNTKAFGYFPKTEGSNMLYNVQTVLDGGVMLERDWSYQPSWFSKGLPCEKYKSTDSNAPKECYSHLAPSEEAKAKIINTESLEIASISKNSNDIIKFLAKNRRPLTLDVTVNFNGWSQSGETYYDEKLRAECLSESSKCGGHVVLLTGYDLNKKVFFFKNSWGKEWGQDGYGTITFDTVDNYGNDELYYAKVTGTMKIPADYNKDPLSIENFSSSLGKDDQGLETQIKLKANGIKNRLLYISSFIMEKSKVNTTPANDANTQHLRLSDEDSNKLGEDKVRSFAFLFEENEDTIDTGNDRYYPLNIPQTTLDLASVTDLFSSTDSDAFLRTTIYVYTDDQDYKALKRIYQPIPIAQ